MSKGELLEALSRNGLDLLAKFTYIRSPCFFVERGVGDLLQPKDVAIRRSHDFA